MSEGLAASTTPAMRRTSTLPFGECQVPDIPNAEITNAGSLVLSSAILMENDTIQVTCIGEFRLRGNVDLFTCNKQSIWQPALPNLADFCIRTSGK